MPEGACSCKDIEVVPFPVPIPQSHFCLLNLILASLILAIIRMSYFPTSPPLTPEKSDRAAHQGSKFGSHEAHEKILFAPAPTTPQRTLKPGMVRYPSEPHENPEWSNPSSLETPPRTPTPLKGLNHWDFTPGRVPVLLLNKENIWTAEKGINFGPATPPSTPKPSKVLPNREKIWTAEKGINFGPATPPSTPKPNKVSPCKPADESPKQNISLVLDPPPSTPQPCKAGLYESVNKSPVRNPSFATNLLLSISQRSEKVSREKPTPKSLKENGVTICDDDSPETTRWPAHASEFSSHLLGTLSNLTQPGEVSTPRSPSSLVLLK